jgi:succinate-acetate transporter protein
MGGRGSNKSCTFFITFFVLTLTFCLVSAGIFKTNTTIGMVAAYATKYKGSSGGDGSGGLSIIIKQY